MDACWQQRLCLWYWSYILSSIITIIPFSYFFLFIREVISLIFFSLFWTFMHEKFFYDQSHHFQLERCQLSIFLAYCCPFSFLHKLSSIQSVLSFIHNYLYTLCLLYNHTSCCPIIWYVYSDSFIVVLFVSLPCHQHNTFSMLYGHGIPF